MSPTFALHSWWCLCNFSRSDQWSTLSLKFLALLSLGFSIAHSCFSRLCAAFPILVQASGHMLSGRNVVWIVVSLSPDHMYPFGGVTFSSINLVKPVHESNRLLFPSTSEQSSIRFSCATSRSVWVDLITSIYFSGIGMILISHKKLNSRFNMMTIDEITLNGPKVLVNPCVIVWFFRLKLLPFTVRFSAEILPPYGRLPPRDGFLEFVVPSWVFLPYHLPQEIWSSVFLGYQDFFCIQSSGKYFWCVQLFQFFNVNIQYVSLPNSPRDQSISSENFW